MPPPIRSAAEINYPPFSIVDDQGRASGFSVELIKASLGAMGRDVTFRTGPWPDVRGWLETGEIQALPLVGRTPERERLFDFTGPYMSLHGAIVVRKETTGIQSLADLKGRTVAVLKGDNAEEFLRRKDRGIRIHTTLTFEEALHDLARGRADAVVMQRLVALRLLEETGLTGLRIINKPVEGFRQDFCFAVREGDRDTLALLNEGLSIVMADGTYRHLHSKWFAALELPSHRRIVIGGDHEYPPFEYLDENGRPAGYNVDLTRAIALAMGLDIEIRLGPWAEIVQAMEEGRIDALQGMFYLPERDLKFDFTQAHTVHHYVSVVRRGEGDPPTTLDDLAGKRIVVQRGDAAHIFLVGKGLTDRLSLVETQEEVLRELSEGKHDCGLAVRISSLYLIQKQGWKNLVLGRQEFLPLDYCYAVPNGHKALLATLSEGLKILDENGEYRHIQKKWLGVYKKQAVDAYTIVRYAAAVLVPLLLVLTATLLWTWSLRKKVAEKTRALQESLDRFQYVFESANVGKSITLPSGEVNANKAFANFLGYSPEALSGKKWQDVTPVEDIENVEKIIAPIFSGEKEAVRFEKRYIHKDGRCLWADVSSVVRRDKDGRSLYLMTTVVDITERKQAESQLKAAKEWSERLISLAPNIVVGLGERSKITIFNRFAEQLTGYKAEEVLGKEWIETFIPEEQRKNIYQAWDDIVDKQFTDHHFINEIITKSGERRLIEWSNTIITQNGEFQMVLSLGVEITERKRAEEALKKSEFQKNLILNNTQELFALYDLDLTIIWANRASADSAGMTPEEMVGKHCYEVWQHRGIPCEGCIILKVKETRQPQSGEAATPDGKIWSVRGYPVLDEQKEVVNLIGLGMDVTEKIQAELKLETYVTHSPTPIFIANSKGEYTFVNPAASELLGYTGDELLSMNIRDVAHPDEYEKNLQTFPELQGRKHIQQEISLLCKDGSKVYVLLDALLLDESNIIAFCPNITERKHVEAEREKMQTRLTQVQKMESVGRLAGGVAHDFNNMLTVISGNAQLALEKLSPDDPLHADLLEILDAARRSTGITRQLLAFARRQAIDPKEIDLNDTVEGMLKMLRRLIGEDINLSWQPGPDRMPVFMDPSQIDQLLANLLVNARDAIVGVGRVTIETCRVRFDEEYCADHAGFIPGEFILLSVSDDGCGMDKDTIENIFEPFFTTKKVGEGTGMGLATVHGIVNQNDGFINVYSEPGKGSTFRIYLPCHHGQDGLIKAHGVAQAPKSRGETVLIVEDEGSILKMVQRILERLGYRVLAASTPGKAEDLAEEYLSACGDAQAGAGPIHLLITDVVMPEMNGRDLAESLKARYPTLKVLFMSGYTANVIAHRGVLDEGVNFIQKPFSNRDLAVKVREVLDRD